MQKFICRFAVIFAAGNFLSFKFLQKICEKNMQKIYGKNMQKNMENKYGKIYGKIWKKIWKKNMEIFLPNQNLSKWKGYINLF